MHSRDYKDFQGFENKRVVIIGLGNSGGDIAVELGICAKQVRITKFRPVTISNLLLSIMPTSESFKKPLLIL